MEGSHERTGKCDRKNSKACERATGKARGAMCEMEWVFVRASNKASQGEGEGVKH